MWPGDLKPRVTLQSSLFSISIVAAFYTSELLNCSLKVDLKGPPECQSSSAACKCCIRQGVRCETRTKLSVQINELRLYWLSEEFPHVMKVHCCFKEGLKNEYTHILMYSTCLWIVRLDSKIKLFFFPPESNGGKKSV